MDSESDVKTAMDSESDVEVAYEPHWHNPKDCTAIVTADFFQKALLAKEERKMLRKLQDMKKALRFFKKEKKPKPWVYKGIVEGGRAVVRCVGMRSQ